MKDNLPTTENLAIEKQDDVLLIPNNIPIVTIEPEYIMPLDYEYFGVTDVGYLAIIPVNK